MKTTGLRVLGLSLAMASVSACRPQSQEESEVKVDVGCIGNYLGQFIEGIPLPGFSALGKIGASIAGNVAGILRNKVAGEVQATCAAPATFSNAQMEQMRQAISDGFNDQNHREATALLNKIDTKLREFVPDEDRFTSYTIFYLQGAIDDINDWWSKYDQSGTRIYNVQDFVMLTGFAMRSYQHQVREVALEAAQSKSPGDAAKVRRYAQILSDKAHHVRVELEDISNNDIMGITKSFWKDGGSRQTKTYYANYVGYAHCYESKTGRPYNDTGHPELTPGPRTEAFLNGMRATRTLAELSRYVSQNGTVCCMDDRCGGGDIENRLSLYMNEVNQQVKKVMFYNDAAIMKYYNETLPMFIRIAGQMRDASDADLFSLAGDGQVPSASGSSMGGDLCPDGDNGQGRGFGTVYQCGDVQCAKTDKSYSVECKVR